MSGIAGHFGPTPRSQAAISGTLQCLGRRGPDGRGIWQGALGQNSLTLVHTRLAIVDLDSRANQPFEDGPLVIVFNGEIYNHEALRDEMISLGDRFRTLSDTEVIVKAYRRWGRTCVDRFEGMWAFALADKQAGTLFVSRDRFGEKPLYYRQRDGGFTFASTVDAIEALDGVPANIDPQQIRRLLVNGHKSTNKARRSYYTDILEVPAAHQAVVTTPTVIHPEPYWRLSFQPEVMSEAEAAEGTREKMLAALEHRLRADVPVAFCLSDGINSGVVAGMAAKHFGYDVHAFSIFDDDPRDGGGVNVEKIFADVGCPVTRIQPDKSCFFDSLSRLVAERNRPVITLSAYMENTLAREISLAGYKVALTGVGAYELFTGYEDHYAFWLAQRANSVIFPGLLADWRHTYGSYVRNPCLQDPEALSKNLGQRDHIYLGAETLATYLIDPFHEPFAERSYTTDTLRNRMLNEIAEETVPVVLQECDANFMAWAVENRTPYLDRHLAEYLCTVPSDHLIKDGLPTWLLRSAAEDFLVDELRLGGHSHSTDVALCDLIDPQDPLTLDFILSLKGIYDIVDRSAVEQLLTSAPWSNSVHKFLFSVISAGLFLDRRSHSQNDVTSRLVA